MSFNSRKSRRPAADVSLTGLNKISRHKNVRAVAWLLRIGFAVALIAAIWMSRPTGPATKPAPNAPIGTRSAEVATAENSRTAGGSLDAANDPADAANESSATAPSPTGAWKTNTNPADDASVVEDSTLAEEPTAEDRSIADDPDVRKTLALIAAGGPYPYRQDDTVFMNREGRLPKKSLGYYREFTVETPGSDDRGARRIVRGERGELYFTEDHYRTFVPLVTPLNRHIEQKRKPAISAP